MGPDFGKSRGEGVHTANPFRGGRMDIFWNHTMNDTMFSCHLTLIIYRCSTECYPLLSSMIAKVATMLMEIINS